ncbi:DUF4116 domain-containing protein [Candidatus Comchoanobacter bicostacola]|uniref:DUF4116 domain-containing protein n=1 Tax=Candidatus Comchoanobacter bicostacola TaxID=2919598 RepID=A0ABY5DK17_9GAMM|nr:DUF4116 domain-containing protein [Candidatus Comchoanobacter bicostacola]UTC24629.1 DUF4116 domain-containing protein [Candidatus Comchoanobacter bicostacola]
MGINDLCSIRETCRYFRDASGMYFNVFLNIKQQFEKDKRAADSEYALLLGQPMLYIQQLALAKFMDCVLQRVSENHSDMKCYWNDHYEIVWESIKNNNAWSFHYASDRLKACQEIAVAAVKINSRMIEDVDFSIQGAVWSEVRPKGVDCLYIVSNCCWSASKAMGACFTPVVYALCSQGACFR